MDKEHKFKVTFFLSNGESPSGFITVTDEKEDYVTDLADWLYKDSFLTFKRLGLILQTKFITHIKVEEVDLK